MINVYSLLIKALTINGEIISVIRFTALITEGLTDLTPLAALKPHVPGWVGWLVERACDTVCSES